MRILFYLIVGAIPGFIFGGPLGVLIGLIGGLLLYVIDQLNALNEKLDLLRKDIEKTEKQ
ncbi:hypothetical protein [Domibacillus robiginosus]|uniref:hypothetical protein n=1 Tax=Domibacillus robiginosus TaxID=1071054 RepID=UPI00067E0DE9|nr:hypothetical protein [Domibacillus robiginosus]